MEYKNYQIKNHLVISIILIMVVEIFGKKIDDEKKEKKYDKKWNVDLLLNNSLKTIITYC